MPAPKYPTINGIAHSHNTARISINGEEFLGITSISYGAALKPGMAKGASSQVIARSQGEQENTCSFEMLTRDGQALINKLGAGYMTKEFAIVCSYPAGEDAVDLVTDEIRRCRITNLDKESSEGGEPQKMKFTVDALEVLFGGVSAIPNSLY